MTNQRRSLAAIARDIRADWTNVSHYAQPYLAAMAEMHTPGQDYILDSEDSVIRYFLANASAWRGAKAREIKAELKSILKARK